MRLSRIGQTLRRELWRKTLPHGLISWRYLLPAQDPRIQIHRRLWWHSRPSWPRPVWLLVNTWLWLRWIGFTGWRAAWHTWRRAAKEVGQRDGISPARQARMLVALSIGNCIPPRDIYRFRLYLAPERAWDYVYDHEGNAFHHWRSLHLGDGETARALLSDKLQLGKVLAEAHVPMVPSLACVPRGAGEALSPRIDDGARLFCKTRRGNRGLGAFAAWRHGDAVAGRGFDGAELPDRAAVEQAWHALLDREDALVQPCLVNHPCLAPLAVGMDAITVRYISLHQGDGYSCLSATLEIPADPDEKSGRPLYVILPIEPGNGEIRPMPDDLLKNAEGKKRHDRVMDSLPDGMTVPHWEALVDASHRAHTHCPELWAIAWDWVITPEGPRLLEGNSGWGTATVQVLQGGLLADPP